MTFVETLCAILAATAGTGFFIAAIHSSNAIRRVLRHRLSKVAVLTNGPAKIAGTLSAREPLTGLDGTAAVAAWRKVVCRRRPDDDGDTGPTTFHSACAEIEVTDETGTCVLEMGAAFIIGPSRSHTFSRSLLEERFPELWADISKTNGGVDIVEVSIDETLVPDGSKGVVAGHAALENAVPQGSAYRDGNRRIEMSGDDEQPLILSAWGEKPLLRYLGGPLLGVVWIGAILWVLAFATIALPLLLAQRAAL
jgi:hypothetical protein